MTDIRHGLFSKVPPVRPPSTLFFLSDRFGERFGKRIAVGDEQAEGSRNAPVRARPTQIRPWGPGENCIAGRARDGLKHPNRCRMAAAGFDSTSVHHGLELNGEVLGPRGGSAADAELQAREHHPSGGHPQAKSEDRRAPAKTGGAKGQDDTAKHETQPVEHAHVQHALRQVRREWNGFRVRWESSVEPLGARHPKGREAGGDMTDAGAQRKQGHDFQYRHGSRLMHLADVAGWLRPCPFRVRCPLG